MKVYRSSAIHLAVLVFVLATADQTMAAEQSDNQPRLRAASLRFGVTAQTGGETESRTGAVIGKVHGPLKTTVTLLEDGPLRICLIATDSSSIIRRNMSTFCRDEVARVLGLPVANVLIFSSHNHSGSRLATNQTRSYDAQYADDPVADLEGSRAGLRPFIAHSSNRVSPAWPPRGPYCYCKRL